MSDMTVSFTAYEGALVRVLGLIERRGYPVDTVQCHRAAAHIEMEVAIGRTSRPLELLARQLRRLHEVRDVRLQTEHRRSRTLVDLPGDMPCRQATEAHR